MTTPKTTPKALRIAQYGNPGAERWQVAVDGVRVEASSVERAHGVVRAIVAVHRGEALIHRDKVNLTSSRARTSFVGLLNTERSLPLSTDVLLALDQAIRFKTRGQQVKGGAPPDVSGKVPAARTLADLERQVERYLLVADPDAIPVMLATVKAHRLRGDDPWLLIVASPGGMKTELVNLLAETPGVYPLSDLTARTFASGLTTGGEDPSLLGRLNDEILLLKDFTTILEKHRDERQVVLAHLREIYDGRFDVVWGTGKELHWRGRLGFIAGVTPVIDKHHAVMAVLGQRFVLLRLRQPDRHDVGVRAMKNSSTDVRWQHQLASATAAFMAGLPDAEPEVPSSHIDTISGLANFVTRARSAVERDGWRRELDYAPEPEMPGRLARQLFSLARGLAIVGGRQQTTDDDIGRVVRVGLDCVPAVRRLALTALTKGDEDLTTTTLAQQVQYSTTTVRRALEDLQTLELVSCEKRGRGLADQWSLNDGWRDAIVSFSEREASRHSSSRCVDCSCA